jgi:NADPH:quinone reductase-like Zn-dependent oxidoreductase
MQESKHNFHPVPTVYFKLFIKYLICPIWLCSVKLFQSLIGQLSSSSSRQSPTEKENMDTVLVAGATGGVGKRVVDVLRKKGIPVRALV